MSQAPHMTPMIRQYLGIKEQHQDAILFFRLGDFYEMFMEDAKVASKALDLTLTGRGKDEARIPMCGVPYHAADAYIQRLVQLGFKVAICEQTSEATEGKGITERAVTKIITPGTNISSDSLDPSENNYIVAINQEKESAFGLAFLDASTGDFHVATCDTKHDLDNLVRRLNPKELLLQDDLSTELTFPESLLINKTPMLTHARAEEELSAFFNVNQLSSFGIDQFELAYPSAWAVVDYLKYTQKHSLSQLTTCLGYHSDQFCIVDAVSIRNLELLTPLFSSQKSGSLYWVLNHSKTAMGARQLKQWITQPLCDIEQINHRLDAVESLKNDLLSREEIREQLKQVYDIERLMTRIASHSNNPRDLIALKESLIAFKDLAAILSHQSGKHCKQMADFFTNSSADGQPIQDIITTIEAAIKDDAPISSSSGNVIKAGFSNELDELLLSFKSIKDWIAGLEQKEKEATGIKSLKVGFNKVFGYYFQVSQGQIDAVPEHYIRKQTLTNAERYITPELKEKETILLHGEEKQIALEQSLYRDITQSILAHISLIQKAARYIAELDCYQSLATAAQKNNYTRPRINTHTYELKLKESRHPVLEKQHPEKVISNDISCDNESHIFLITGPNMAGKSTLMKQVAITVLMAQMGSFVPADEATISICDRIFTRIGASDNLSEGQSTFMVEMTETATILHNASANSLILLDEIGRGTSTYDGMSIAGAVLRYIHDDIKARTFFATHYHELSSISDHCSACKNMSMAIQEYKGSLSFTYKYTEGPADKSYGVHVAEMAGLPKKVLNEAATLLNLYESQSKNEQNHNQLTLF